MNLITLRGALTALCLLLACLVSASCGDDDGTSEASSATAGLGSEPARLVQTILDEIVAAKKTSDCKVARKVNLRSPVKMICPPLGAGAKETRQMRLIDADVYGPAAVVDFKSPKARKGASIVLIKDPKGQWAIMRLGLLANGSVGTEPDPDREGARAALDNYLQAVETRDCPTYSKYAATQTNDRKTTCSKEFPLTKKLARDLSTSSDAEVAYVGGNASFGFYTVDLSPGTRPVTYVVSTLKLPEGALRSHVVLDAKLGPSES